MKRCSYTAALCLVFACAAEGDRRGPGGRGTYGFRSDCDDTTSDSTLLSCIAAAPNNRHSQLATTEHVVYFRPEVKSLTEISDRKSEFYVKIEQFTYWYDPAVTRNTDILDDIPPGAYTALWSPKSIYPEEMLSYEVLIPGESRYMTSSEVPAKKYGPPEIANINMARHSVIRYLISNVGAWSMGKYPFDSRALSWTWQNREPWVRRKYKVFIYPLSPIRFNDNQTLIDTYAGALQTNDMTDFVPSTFAADGDMELTSVTQCSVDDTDTSSGVFQTIPIKRKWEYALATYVIPVLMCSLVGLFSLWVPIGVAMPRFAASVIPMLTVATVKRSLDSLLPPSAQESLLVNWLMVQITILGMCSLITQIGFVIRHGGSDGILVQQYADCCYRKGLILLFLLSVPIAYLMGAADSFMIVLLWLLTPCFLCFAGPSALILLRIQQLEVLRGKWIQIKKRMSEGSSGHDVHLKWVRLLHRENEPATAIASDQWYTVACNEDSKVDNPLLTPVDVDGAADVDAVQLTDVDVADVGTSADDGEALDREAALDTLISQYFNRYDLDGSGSLNSNDELQQLVLNLLFYLKNVRPDLKLSSSALAHIRATTGNMDELTNDNAMDLTQFSKWFKQQVDEQITKDAASTTSLEMLS